MEETKMIDILLCIYLISASIVFLLLIFDLIVVYILSKITDTDMIGSIIIIIILGFIPIVQWWIIIWVIKDIKFELNYDRE